jgi:hypothetical protein
MYGAANNTDGSKDLCLSCPNNTYLQGGTCVGTCADGSYHSGSVCVGCRPVCATCSSASSCLSCSSPLNLLGGECLAACPAGYVSVLNSSSLSSCLNCPSSCLVCLSISSCSTCEPPFLLNAGSCVSTCPGALLPNYLGQCVACDCLSCSLSSYNCTSCSGATSLYNGQCLANCPSGYYSSSNVCTACGLNCAACTSSAYCSICYLPYVLSITSVSSSSCVLACTSGTIASISPSNFSYLCASCSSNCLSCQTSTDYCLSCSSSFLLSNHSCVLACPSGQFNYSGQCVYCFPSCRSCDPASPATCYVCAGGYFLSGNSCLSSCPNGTYADILALACSGCDPLCSSCVNSTNCTACSGGLFLHLNYCYSNCSAIDSNYYSYLGQCLYCQPQCAACYPSSPYACTACASGEYYHNPATFACTTACTHPYYADAANSQCILCSSPCASCDTAFDSCLTCLNGLLGHKGACVAVCPSGYKNVLGTCLPCSSYCLECEASGCLACQPYAYLYRGSCVLDCSVYPDLPITVDNYCTSCAQVPYCQQCQSTVGTGFACFLCLYPYVVFDGECLNQCPQYYAPDTGYNCQPTPAYAAALNEEYERNMPKLPPFSFLLLGLLGALLLWLLARKAYAYTYHCGYLLALGSIIDAACLLYGAIYIYTLYKGDYTGSNLRLPLLILGASLGCKLLLSACFLFGVVYLSYLSDVRYSAWASQNRIWFRAAACLMVVLGPRFHKLLYSKFLAR